MKPSKQVLSSLIILSLFKLTGSYAAFSQMISPNKIPRTFILHATPTSKGEATLSFPNSSLPAKFLCYFSAGSNQRNTEVVVRVDSAEDNIEFLPGTDDLMQSSAKEVKMFTISSARNHHPIGQVHFSVEENNSKFGNNDISITCTMSK